MRTFRLVHPAGSDLPFGFEPGQFLTVSVNIDGKEAKRSYSIASLPCRAVHGVSLPSSTLPED